MAGLDNVKSLTGTLSEPSSLRGILTVPATPDTYEGSYVVTPSDTEQILQTANLLAAENVTIKAIPPGYGKLVWNGSYLTIY